MPMRTTDELNRISYLKLEGGVSMGQGYGAGFALIVVLFILLIIVGAAWL